jgi:hypothetical protein
MLARTVLFPAIPHRHREVVLQNRFRTYSIRTISVFAAGDFLADPFGGVYTCGRAGVQTNVHIKVNVCNEGIIVHAILSRKCKKGKRRTYKAYSDIPVAWIVRYS